MGVGPGGGGGGRNSQITAHLSDCIFVYCRLFSEKMLFRRGGGGCYTFSDSPWRWLFGDVWLGGGGGMGPYFLKF